MNRDVPLEWHKDDVILDLYEVKHIFTTGGMGLVYRVHHRNWNIDLAVKSPRQKMLAQAGGTENFVAEAETWVNLGLHPHIVTCHYVRTLGGIPRVFAEFVEGGSLKDWIEEGRLRDLQTMLDVAIQFAWGLHYAHEQDLIHRDVKPANTLMTPEGIAKVTDFGLAKARPVVDVEVPDEAEGTVLMSRGGMTPAYCSPEQAGGKPLTHHTDIWSWGVSILEMFVGEVTWLSGVAAAGVLEMYLEEGTEVGGLPPMPLALADLLRRCFQEEPKARPGDMLEVAERLQEIYRQEVGQAYPREMPEAAELRADSLNNRALSLLDLGRAEEAEKVWEQALQTETNHPQATYNLGLILWRSGRMTDDLLVRKMGDVCASRSGEWLPLYLLGQVHLEQGDWQAAVEALEGIEGQDASQEEVVFALALAKDQLVNSRRLLRTFEGHTDPVISVYLSADGRYALSGGGDKTLRLWDVASSDCLRTFEGHTGWVQSVCLSADGRYALSGSGDKTLRLWDVASGDCLRTFEGHTSGEFGSEVQSVCLSADGRYALSGSEDHTLRLWEVASGKCLRTFEGHRLGVQSVCLSADGRYALSGGWEGTLKLWDVASGECLRTFEGHKDYVRSVCMSADGRYALSGSGGLGFDNTLRLWDVASGECLRTFEGHTKRVLSVCLSADGRFALSGSEDQTLKLWDVASGKCLRTFKGHASFVHSVSLSADGRCALSGSHDKTLKLWQVDWDAGSFSAPLMLSRVLTSEIVLSGQAAYERAMAQAQEALQHGDSVTAAQYIRLARSQPGYERAAEALQEWGRLYVRLVRKSLRSGWESATLEGHKFAVNSVCLSADGRFALSGSDDSTLKLWDVSSGKCLRTFEGHKFSVNFVCLSADGHYALSGSGDKTFRLWDMASGKCLRTFDVGSRGSGRLSADGRYAVSVGDDYVKLWEVGTGRCLRTFRGHTSWMQSVSLSADGRYVLSGSSDRTLRLWDAASGECLRTFQERDTGFVYTVCLSADGRYALSGSGGVGFDNMLMLWELASGRCLRVLRGHRDLVNSVCLSADGRYALSGGHDRTLRLWDLSSGECLRTFEGHTGSVNSVCLSADGRYALSGSKDTTLRLWELDWELEDNQTAEWDEGARPYLEMFLSLHTPYAGVIPQDREPTEEEIALALTRRGKPAWVEEDFQQLLHTLGCAGYGWLQAEGVRRKLEKLAAARGGQSPRPPEGRPEETRYCLRCQQSFPAYVLNEAGLCLDCAREVRQ